MRVRQFGRGGEAAAAHARTLRAEAGPAHMAHVCA